MVVETLIRKIISPQSTIQPRSQYKRIPLFLVHYGWESLHFIESLGRHAYLLNIADGYYFVCPAMIPRVSRLIAGLVEAGT